MFLKVRRFLNEKEKFEIFSFFFASDKAMDWSGRFAKLPCDGWGNFINEI